ncbi:MAG TPA: glycosyl hydrolase family 18 protein [Cytophagaceae bacterium]|nr:glycosyl hydrolase family 18 protein [Cytophagaceae bacterium]
MTRVNKKAVFYLLLSLNIILPTASIKAQVELKSMLDKAVDGKIDKANSQKKNQEQQIIKSLRLDSIPVVKKDSAIKQDDLQVLEQAILFDTTEFKKRNMSVKSRRPDVAPTNEQGWQKELLLTNTNVYKKEHKLDSTKTVFGWHPYWMGTAYCSYNFSLLSAIAYFSYEMDPSTGYYRSIHDWRTTSLFDSAHAHGCKVLLSVTNFGSKNNALFLSNKNAQRTFINTIITLLRERNGDGVNIDFEDISRANRNDLSNFIIDLSSSLKAAGKNYLITIALPAIDFDYVYEIKQLNQYVDLFIIMGYEFYGQNSKVAGPVSPLSSGKTWWPYNLETAVDEYIISGITPSKLLLGLPYYGAEWQTKDLKFPSKVEKFIRYPMYRNIKKEHGVLLCCEDDDSKSMFHVYRDDNNRYRQIWYEDEKSLAKKYDWVSEKKIGGVGIWALGYDNGYTELWKLIAEKFSEKPKPLIPVKEASIADQSKLSFRRFISLLMRLITNPKALLSRPGPLIGIFGSLFGVSLGGIFIMIRYGHRFKRFYKIIFQGGIALMMLILFSLIFVVLKYAGFKEVAYLLGGFLVAGILFLIFARQFLIERDLP